MSFSRSLRFGPAFVALCGSVSVLAAPPSPVFKSPLVDVRTPGHAVEIDVDLAGARSLFLVVTDGGDGYGADWADWVDPRVTGDFGEKSLIEVPWKRAQVGWGKAHIGKASDGGPMRVAGRDVNGISAHANSMIEFDLPAGARRFKATGAIDEGGSKQGGSSVQFQVFTSRPPFERSGPTRSGGGRSPADELAALDVAPGLEATLFASEPLLLSPSAIDIDEHGRVWVAEVVNYRGHNGRRPEGDRIVVLEDTDHDGRADRQTVFFQSREIDSPHGVCVLGNRVIVSASGRVHVLTDDNGDLKADRQEILFSGVGGPQHDHGVHQFMFGPDGRLYFNIGNAGQQIRGPKGEPIVDVSGVEVREARQPYQEGMVMRCEPDGSRVEVLGWNFRNEWEVAVDSFGTVWQSDNDDDGNQGVRILYVMEGGNFGYRDEMTGASWQEPRTNLEPEIPRRHWHQNDPGVVPNLLLTGAGSPTGLIVYEGDLLPEVFRNQMIHCDAGPNVVRAYPVRPSGAGFAAETVNLLEGARDKWFRPSDVQVAPDGSLIVADWYDPGVGGHAMGDLDRGRLFRVAPPGSKYAVPKIDLSSPAGAVAALESPNHAVRFRAWIALREFGPAAAGELERLWRHSNPRLRARALWLLGHIDGPRWVDAAVTDPDENIRLTGIRLARRLRHDVIPVVARLVNDRSIHVRRECALGLRHNDHREMPALWAALAAQHDGRDRWYLEALGIGADRRWDECLAAWLARSGADLAIAGDAGRDIIWRSRSSRSPELLARIIAATAPDAWPRYFRAFDFLPENETKRAVLEGLLAKMMSGGGAPPISEIIRRLPRFDRGTLPGPVMAAVTAYLPKIAGSPEYFEIVERFGLRDEKPKLLELAATDPGAPPGVGALKVLLAWGELDAVAQLTAASPGKAAAILGTLGATAHRRAVEWLRDIISRSETAPELRLAAVEALTRSRSGERELLALARDGKLPPPAREVAGKALTQSTDERIRSTAAKVFTAAAIPLAGNHPPVSELIGRTGDSGSGKALFTALCQTCHQVGGQGVGFGPALDEIGTKLPREQLFVSILDPNQGISFGYEGWEVATRDGATLVGLITSESDDAIVLRAIGGVDNRIAKSSIAERKKIPVSLMTPLAPAISEAQLVDLVEFLATLKKK